MNSIRNRTILLFVLILLFLWEVKLLLGAIGFLAAFFTGRKLFFRTKSSAVPADGKKNATKK